MALTHGYFSIDEYFERVGNYYRLLQNEKEQEVFQEILKKAAEKKLIPQNSVRQIIDSTCTLGAGEVQDTYTLIRKSIYKLIQELQERINIIEIIKDPLKLNYQAQN